MSNTEMDLQRILEQLRKDGVTGQIYFMDPDQGNNAFDGLSPEFPFQTLAGAYAPVVTNRGDAIVIIAKAGGVVDFNVAGVGFTIAKDKLTIYAINDIIMNNSNAGATHILRVNADRVRLHGIGFSPTGNLVTVAVHIAGPGDFTEIDHCKFASANVSIHIQASYCNIHDNLIMSTAGLAPMGIQVDDTDNEICNNKIFGSTLTDSMGIALTVNAARVTIKHNTIEYWEEGINTPVAGIATAVISHNRFRCSDINSLLTVLNGTGTITVYAFYAPCSGVQFHINCAYAGGPNNSFKTNAAPGAVITFWVEEYSVREGAWRRMTPDAPECKLRTTDALDVLVISDISTAGQFRLRCAMDIAPTATVDLDYTMLVNTEV